MTFQLTLDVKNLKYSVFSRIWTEYGEIRRTCSYSVRMRENKGQKNFEHELFLCSVQSLTIFNCHPSERLYSPARIRNKSHKNSIIFDVFPFPRFYILLSKNWNKVFNLKLLLSILLNREQYLQWHIEFFLDNVM